MDANEVGTGRGRLQVWMKNNGTRGWENKGTVEREDKKIKKRNKGGNVTFGTL